MKIIIFIITIFASNIILAQNINISGEIISSSKEKLAFINIFDKTSKKGTATNINGSFSFNIPKGNTILKLSAIGYEQQLINIELLKDTNVVFILEQDDALLDEFVISGTLSEISKKNSAIPIEDYSSAYLNKVPVPSLLEATQNINGVRPQLNCAVCNTGDIHINGMEGPYTMITIDGMPIVGGLSTVYGLQGIPGSLLKRVEVVKGPASTIYGSEAVAGLINVITKDVYSAPKLSLNFSSTSWREIQTDLMFKFAEDKKVSGIIGIDYHNYSLPIDNNGDNFTDLTLKDRISVFNKLNFKRKDNKIATLTTRYLYEDRWGGEMQWTPEFRGGDSVYGESIYTNRAEIMLRYQLPGKEKLILSSSYSYHNQNSVYGTLSYNAIQQIGFSQLVWHKNLNLKHKLLSGIAIRYNYYDDNTSATEIFDGISLNNPDKWILPGVFIQDKYSVSEKLVILTGIRLDYHLAHGSVFSPRTNIKWSPNQKTSVRLGYGNGFRVVNVFTEDHAALTGARDVIFKEDLNPESSNNININIEKQIETSWTYINLDASVFYTHFSNKILPDYNTDDNQIIYTNLDGYAVSKGLSLNVRMMYEMPLKINFGITLLDVYSMQKNESDILVKEQQLFTEPYTATWSVSYLFMKPAISIDYTGNLYGPMKLPILENDFRNEYSNPFSIQNIKISKEFLNGLEIFCGVKNLLNFTPSSNSILRAHDPFDKLVNNIQDNPNGYTFDPSYIYTSFQGINYFMGLKYNIQ